MEAEVSVKELWAGLSAKGRAVVIVVLVLAGAGLLALAMWLGYRMDWLPPIFGQLVGGGQ